MSVFEQIGAVISGASKGDGESRDSNKAQGVDVKDVAAAIAAPLPTDVAGNLVRADDPTPAAHQTPEGQQRVAEKVARGQAILDAEAAKLSAAEHMILERSMAELATSASWTPQPEDRDEANEAFFVEQQVAAVTASGGDEEGLLAAGVYTLQRYGIEVDDEFDWADYPDELEEAQMLFQASQQTRLAQAEGEYAGLQARVSEAEQQARGQAVEDFFALEVPAGHNDAPYRARMAELLQQTFGGPEAAAAAIEATPTGEIQTLLAQVAISAKATRSAHERAEFGQALLDESTRTSITDGLSVNGSPVKPREIVPVDLQLADLGVAAGVSGRGGDVDVNELLGTMKKTIKEQGAMSRFAERALKASDAENARRHPRR